MATIARLIGGAGTGKTTELMNLMAGVLERGIKDPMQIGFVSFTRAARAEAAARASAKFHVASDDLERHGNFRTLHSICYRALGVEQDALITGSKKSAEWLNQALDESVAVSQDIDGDLTEAAFASDTAAGKALHFWGAARNRLGGLEHEWQQAMRTDDTTPPWSYVQRIVNRYEEAKRLDGKVDFTDLLGKFSGVRFDLEGPSESTYGPDGEVPALPVWFFDEQQDASPLLDKVCHRLINTPACQWVYVVGDPFQAIFTFAGADSRCFRAWPADKERIMPKSWRCPKPFLALGERCLRQCSDYFDRGIAPADHEGRLYEEFGLYCLAGVDPSKDTLLLGRTNFHAQRIARVLDDHAIPWCPTKGNSTWLAPVRNGAIAALHTIEQGGPISGKEWQNILDVLPSKVDGAALFLHGTKKRFESKREADGYQWVFPHELDDLGATTVFLDLVRSRQWRGMVKHTERTLKVLSRPDGAELLAEPKIRVGTVHSVKGAEADHVYVLTSTNMPVERSQETREGFDAERRVEYVAATRARHEMTIIREPAEMKTGRFMKIAS